MPEIVKLSKSSEFVSLVEAYLRPELYGDISQMFVDYTPDKDSVIIAPMPSVALSFAQKVRVFPECLGWKAWVRTNKKGEVYKVYFVATGLTSQIFFGRNQNGWKNVDKITDQIVNAFGNQKLGSKGVRFTKDIYKAMPNGLKPQMGRCMIFSTMKEHVTDNHQFRYLYNGIEESITKHYTDQGICTTAVEFLPIVEVPKDIMVKVGSRIRNGFTPESSLRIKRAKTSANSKA